ncbi:MAG: 50S ribosomal protein L44e [Nitrososphaerota archaeon]|nr:50S ribosomal protein L44e [Nitrososphaerota archaeon]
MKYPKTRTMYCPKCKKHTEHTVSLYKKGKERAFAEGTRRHAEEKKGYGGQKYAELVRTAKTTKKSTLMLKCKVCGFVVGKKGIRVRKVELVES